MKEILQKVDFFNGLDDKLLSQVAEAAIMRRYGKDETIVHQGQTGLGMYIVVRGSVRVVREQGGAQKEVARLGPEQVFAEMSILDDKPRSANVITAEDSECLLLTRDSFVKLMKKNPEIPMRVARVLADRLRDANEKLATAGGGNGEAAAPQAASKGAAIEPATLAGSAATGVPPVVNANGASSGGTTKAGIQDSLLSFFENLYTIKAFTRFSVAVLGCPVEAVADNIHEQIRVGEVKAVILPADEPVDMRIVASEAGRFTLHLFTPGSPSPRRWGPEAITPDDDVRLSLRAEVAELSAGGVALGTVIL